MPKGLFNIAFTLPSPPAYLRGNARAEYIAQRAFYNMTAHYNYFSYTLDKKKVVKNANAEHYFTRNGTNTGLFNLKGVLNEEQKQALKAKLKSTKSIIWHGFVSFDEDVSRGFNTQENAIKFMRQTFGGFLERAGFKKDNIELYCSLHDDTDNRHIHYAFFEKEPKRRDKNGVLGYTRRGKIDARAIDNYLVSANMHLSEHGDEYYTARDEAIASLNEVRKQAHKQPAIVAKQELNIALHGLMNKLPTTGRLGYNSANMSELRPEIDRVTRLLIASDNRALLAHESVLKQLARIKQETFELVRENKLMYVNDRRMGKEEIKAAMENGRGSQFVKAENVDYFERLDADYRARIGNITIGICRDLCSRDVGERRRAKVNDKSLKIGAKNRRLRRENVLAGAIRALCATSNYYERTNFIKTVQQNEYEIDRQRKYGRTN